MKSVKEQLFSFLQSNPSVYHGGALQRMNWATRRGGNATGDSIKRRLNELAAEGRIKVSSNDKNEAMFSIEEAHKKKEEIYYIRNPRTGEMLTTEEYSKL